MSFADRLNKLLFDKGLKQSDFSRITGYPQAKLSNILTGKTIIPKIDILETFDKYFPEVSLDWLVTGKGEMYRTDAELLQIAGQYIPEEDSESQELLKKLIELQDHRIKQLEEELKKK